jgi:hypothetical protein
MTTIVTRAGKGSALTWTEGDDNFTNLNTAKLENVVEDTTPQLGGDLDMNGRKLVTVSNGAVTIAPNGSGSVVINEASTGPVIARRSSASGTQTNNLIIQRNFTGNTLANMDGHLSALAFAQRDSAAVAATYARIGGEYYVDGSHGIVLEISTNNFTNATRIFEAIPDGIVVGPASGTTEKVIYTGGAQDIVIGTNLGDDSGSIRIAKGVDGDITIAPDGTGVIALTHGDDEMGAGVKVGNGTNQGVIFSNGATGLTFIADVDNEAGAVFLTLGSDGKIFLTPRAGSTVDIETSVTRLGTSEAAATLTSNGAHNLVLSTNNGAVGSVPTITMTSAGGISLQATAGSGATNTVSIVSSVLNQSMNASVAGAGTVFAQAHTTADANNFALIRARGTTLSPSAVQTGDELAEFVVSGHDGQTGAAGYEPAWGFTTVVTDTPTSNVMPTRTNFVINTAASTLTTYHSIATDLVFRVVELGTVAGVDDLFISAGEDGDITIAPDGVGAVRFGADADLPGSSIQYRRTYGCFHKTAAVTAAAADTVYEFNWTSDTTAHVNTEGITVSDTSRLNIDAAGDYMVTLEFQAKNTDNADRLAWIWLAKNGTNLTETAIQVKLQKENEQIITKQWLVEGVTAAQYLEVRFAVDNPSGISLQTVAAQTSPFVRPAVPSATITITPVGA